MGRRIWVLFIAAVAATAGALLWHLSLLAFGLYALLAALVLAELLASQALRGVRYIRQVDVDRARIGDDVEVRAVVRNEKPLPVLWVLVEDVLPPRLAATGPGPSPVEGETARLMMLPPLAERRMVYTVRITHRGYHRIGPAILESGDLFGFIRRFRVARAAHYITVRPEPEPILRYDLATHRPIGEVTVRYQLYEDPTRMVGVREYRVGDALNRIHWRATARTGKLHSKVYEPSTMAGAMVAVDFRRAAYGEGDAFDRSELAVKAAASIAAYLCELKQTVGFISNGIDAAERIRREGDELPEMAAPTRRAAQEIAGREVEEDRLRPVQVRPRRGMDQALQILDALARLELSDGLTFERMLLEESPAFPRDLALVLIVPDLPESLVDVLARLKFWGYLISVYVIRNQSAWAHGGAALAAANIPVTHIEKPEHLRELAGMGI